MSDAKTCASAESNAISLSLNGDKRCEQWKKESFKIAIIIKSIKTYESTPRRRPRNCLSVFHRCQLHGRRREAFRALTRMRIADVYT